MNSSTLIAISVLLIILILLSAFFSLSETALIAVNRYRLKHKARLRDVRSILLLKLLKNPDRLLSGILIGNTFANILASSLSTLLAIALWGETGAVIAAVLLTFIILIFSEIAPKTFAALYADKLAPWVALPIHFLIRIGYPLIWFANSIANQLLKLFGIHIYSQSHQPLEQEELRSLVYESAGKMPKDHQNMLLNILDLNDLNVDDVMIPVNNMIGLDIDAPWEKIVSNVLQTKTEFLPVYKKNRNAVMGILHTRKLLSFAFSSHTLGMNELMQSVHPAQFVPTQTPLRKQMMRFQQHNEHVVFVVDEYGDVLGSLTLNDILEEIIGHFTSQSSAIKQLIQQQKDGYLVHGSLSVRDFNRITGWSLPVHGAKTLNGLITEHMGILPKTQICTMIQDHPIEIIAVEQNQVKQAKIFPAIKKEADAAQL